MWKLYFIQPIVYKAIIWMIVNLSHVSCQMFLVKLLILYMISSHVFSHMCFIEFIPFGLANVLYVAFPHNSHVSFTCVLWNLSLGALSITPYQCFFFNSFSFFWSLPNCRQNILFGKRAMFFLNFLMVPRVVHPWEDFDITKDIISRNSQNYSQ